MNFIGAECFAVFYVQKYLFPPFLLYKTPAI